MIPSLVLGLACATAPDPDGPVETRRPNARDQVPAFEGQTRRRQHPEQVAFRKETVATGLEHPWGLAVLPDGRYLVTERPGRMRVIRTDGTLGEPLRGVPPVVAENQGGLLDVVLAPDFGTSRMVYWSYAEPRGGAENGTSVARGRLGPDERALTRVQVIFRQEPAWASHHHFGSRIVFAPDGTLYVTTGERGHEAPRLRAQSPADHIGTVVRIRPDGTAPPDNPFVGQADKRPEVWSYGHRNLQGAALDAQGRLWTVEHGPRGGDELNRPEAGVNHGWPTITYGIDYNGQPIYDGLTAHDGMAQPVYYWDPVIAPSGMHRYTGALFPALQGDFLVGGLGVQAVVRLTLAGDRVAYESWMKVGGRVRDIAQAPDGSILYITDASRGKLMRLVPK